MMTITDNHKNKNIITTVNRLVYKEDENNWMKIYAVLFT